jgi:hypothetical protein
MAEKHKSNRYGDKLNKIDKAIAKLSGDLKEIGMFHDPIGYKKSEPNPNDQIYTKKFVGTSDKKGHPGYIYDIFKNGVKVATIEGEGNANAWINAEKRKIKEGKEKHKSKYKSPKDLEKSQKPKPRKDLKDYTAEDKDEKMNLKSTGEKQKNVLRKTDKPVIDNGSLVPDIKDSDRMYDVSGEKHDPKRAAKVMSKRQDDDEKENKKNIKDKIENLTREQKERLVREYIRRRIKNVLKEQSTFSDDLKRVHDNLTRAMKEAQRISKEEGVGQHVNHIGKGQFDVSDWYDSDNTVASFDRGRRIDERLKEQEQPEDDTANNTAPAELEAPAPEPEAPAESPEPVATEPAAPTDQPKTDVVDSDAGPEKVYLDFLRRSSPSAMDLVKNIMKLGVQVASDYEYDDQQNFYKLLKLATDKLYGKQSTQITR